MKLMWRTFLKMAFFQVLGTAALLKAMQEAIKAAKEPQEYWVGSAVFYGPFHEFGTSKLPARPHWGPAIRLVSIRNGGDHRIGDQFVNRMLVEANGMVKLIAFQLEREVKIQIRAAGVIDTGNYRGSIAAAPTEQEAFRESVGQTINSEVSIR